MINPNLYSESSLFKELSIEQQKTDVNDLIIQSQYMPRPRIDKILDQGTQCKLVYVIAGAGYGKTRAVRHYVEQYPDAVIRWVQLTEKDNIGSYYWENLTHNISFDNPELALKLRELGFPETLVRFKQFAEILKSTEHRAIKTFLVLDDFHLIHSKHALTFAERCAHLRIPGACVIIISRKEPQINTASLFSKGLVSIITEDELCFTDDEVADFLEFLSIPYSVKNLPLFINTTKGWAIAIQLLTLVLKRKPGNIKLALDTMKQNIYRLFETEAFNDYPENIQRDLVKLSLVSNLPLAISQKLFNGATFLQDAPQMASFIWFDSLIGDYRIHPLYLEFLQSRHDLLSPQEKQNTYHQGAQWCFENKLNMDAMNYFAKSNQYERMLDVFLSYQQKLPFDTCEYFLNILENIDPDKKEQQNYSVLLLKNVIIPLLILWMDRYEEARERSLQAIREWERSDLPFASNLLGYIYGNLAYIDMYLCTATHKYEAPKYLKKSAEYFKRSSLPTPKAAPAFAVADIRSFACLVGEGADLEEFDRFLDAARQAALYTPEASYNIYCGYEDLVACEIAFFKNQPDTAKKHAHQAILKARQENQHTIEAMAAQYLLRVAIHEGDYDIVNEILKQEQKCSEDTDFWGRQKLRDFFTGLFYAQIGKVKPLSLLFMTEEKETADEVRIPTRELLIGIKHYCAAQKYDQALTLICNSANKNPYERFLFGELTLSLLTAVARIKTNDTPGAIKDFEKAYSLSYNGIFEMPFIERGKDLQPLIAAASKQASCSIPGAWLRMINRKASIYSKKAAVILESFKKDNKIENTIQLSKREKEIINDLYHGLTREEIAENRYISLPTVKKIIESAYIKLDANNIADAIRIAIKNDLIVE